jgi:hypothetical protein
MIGEFHTSSERYIQGVHIMFGPNNSIDKILGVVVPKKHCLGPQNGLESLGPEQM